MFCRKVCQASSLNYMHVSINLIMNRTQLRTHTLGSPLVTQRLVSQASIAWGPGSISCWGVRPVSQAASNSKNNDPTQRSYMLILSYSKSAGCELVLSVDSLLCSPGKSEYKCFFVVVV